MEQKHLKMWRRELNDMLGQIRNAMWDGPNEPEYSGVICLDWVSRDDGSIKFNDKYNRAIFSVTLTNFPEHD